MTPTPINGYCTLADLQSADVLNSPTTPAYSGDAQFLCDIITGVSRAIDTETSRFFYKASTSDEVRYFTAKDKESLFVGDMVSVTSVITDSSNGDRSYPYTWATTDFDLVPYDAANHSEPEPYRFIDRTPQGHYYYPINLAKGVKVTGIWGWPEIPALIAKACILWSARIYMRMKSPLGETAATAFGVSKVIPPPDHDVEIMIMNYSRPAV